MIRAQMLMGTDMNYKLLALSISALALTACATTKKAVEPVAVTAAEPVKYEKLVYGAEMPLVCTNPVPADGALKGRPNLHVMWENYLYDRPEGIWSEIGGMVEVNGNLPLDQGRWTNACTVRVSHMLNKAGYKVKRDGRKTVSGANKDQYYYRVADFEKYMRAEFGEPDVDVKDGNSFDLPPTPGIVLMDFPNSSFTGHVTIWNGAGTVDGAEIGGYKVLFWNMPCFMPPERDITTPSASLFSKDASIQALP